MADSAMLQGIFQCPRYGLLPGYVRECVKPVFAIERFAASHTPPRRSAKKKAVHPPSMNRSQPVTMNPAPAEQPCGTRT